MLNKFAFDKYDIALITDEKERLYYLGFHSTAGYAVVTRTSVSFVVDNRYFKAAEKNLSKKGVKVISGADYSALTKIAEESGAKTLGIDFTKVTIAEYENLKKLGYDYADISSELTAMAAIKSDEELKYIKKACDIAEKSWLNVLPFIKEGITEKQLAAELEYNFRKLGAGGTSFDTIVAFGKNAAVPHHETGDTKLKKNQCVLMDFGCLYKGYCSDMTRTMFFGEPDEEFERIYLAVLLAHKTAAANIRAGITGKEADKYARDVLESLGYGRYFTHSLGHGIGVNIHEFPTLSPRGEAVLEDGMVFSDEPGVYLNGKFGVRIEDSCYLKIPHLYERRQVARGYKRRRQNRKKKTDKKIIYFQINIKEIHLWYTQEI